MDKHAEDGEELSEKDFHRLSDLTLGELMVKLEALIEETPGIADSDLEYSQVHLAFRSEQAFSFQGQLRR